MRKILIILTFITLSSNSYAIYGWIEYQTPLNERVRGIAFVNSLTGWALGDSGRIIKSTNGGVSWILQNMGTNYRMSSLSFINENTGWIAGGSRNLFALNNYYLYGTTNGGSTWDSIYYGIIDQSYINRVYLQSPNLGFMLGDGGNGSGTQGFFYKSTDFGNSWITQLWPTHTYPDIKFKDNNTGWVLTHYIDDIGHDTTTIMKTTNAGLSWFKIYSRRSLNLSKITYIGNDDLIITGESFMQGNQGRFFLRSTNGGASWDSTLLTSGFNVIPYFVSFNIGWWSDQDGIYKTTDGGISFINQFTSPAYSIFFIDSLNGWAAGENGVIYRTVTGGVTGIAPINNSIPGKMSLYQNYPNPFNPSTLIKFDIAWNSHTNITIFDNTGRLIESLLNQSLSPGTYEVQWNAESYPSGVYYYRLETDGFSQTKKMLLIK